MSTFAQHFNLKYPIIGAPMFLVSTVKLVVAVSEAGGLGTFPALNYRPVEKFQEVVREIKSKTQKPFGVNLIVQKSNPHLDRQLEICCTEKVPLIITSLGKPDRVIKQAHGAGTKVYCDVISLEHAKKVMDLGADGLIAVSYGAGGHAGNLSPFVLLPLLRKNFSCPIVAAGGIVDSATMQAARSLGADAFYMGTRLIASNECEVSDEYKQAIIQASAGDVINTDKVDGYPGNFILTPTLQNLLQTPWWEKVLQLNPKWSKKLSEFKAGKMLFGKEQKISYKTVFSAGQAAGLIEEVLPVEEIFKRTFS